MDDVETSSERALAAVALWSQEDSAPLRETLAEHFDQVVAERFPVMLQDRDEFYWLVRGMQPKSSR